MTLAERVIDLAIQIQQIPAPTFEEAGRAEFVRAMFEREGLDVSVDEVGNVYGRLTVDGHKSQVAKPLIVTAHLDTVFPEGTTHRGDDVQPFKPGVLVAASGLDVEIVPMGVAYPDGAEYWQESFVAHLGRFARRPRTRVGVSVGEPRRAKARAAVLAEELHAEVQRLTHEARTLVDR